MQNTLNSSIFSGQTCIASESANHGMDTDFDLEPQFENSNSLEGYLRADILGSTPVPITSTCVGSIKAEIPDKVQSSPMLTLLGVGRNEQGGEPTLAELNMDPVLMEDIISLISNEEDEERQKGFLDNQTIKNQQQESASDNNSVVCIQSVGHYQPPKGASYITLPPCTLGQTATVTSLHNSNSQLFPNRTACQNVSVAPTTLVTDIKIEPKDPEEKSCLHKLLTQKPAAHTHTSQLCNRQTMPIVGHKRAPPLEQVKSESVEEKWKEIEMFIHNPESPSKRKRYGKQMYFYQSNHFYFMLCIFVCISFIIVFLDLHVINL